MTFVTAQIKLNSRAHANQKVKIVTFLLLWLDMIFKTNIKQCHRLEFCLCHGNYLQLLNVPKYGKFSVRSFNIITYRLVLVDFRHRSVITVELLSCRSPIFVDCFVLQYYMQIYLKFKQKYMSSFTEKQI